jgi:uncharacterized protein YbjT (DUF2867 family)
MIAVVGGTGTVGSRAVERLSGGGREVLVLSRNAPDRIPDGVTHRSFDLTSDDPAPVLSGIDVLLDLANSTSRPGKVLLDGTASLLAACSEAGVGHYVGISIIGCEKVGLGYYRAKTRQEQLIRESPVPWSLLRASQFHELIGSLMLKASAFRLLPGGAVRLQPVAASEVGSRMAEIARAEPLNRFEQMAGPEVFTLGELARIWKQTTGSSALTLPIPLMGRTGRALRSGVLTDPGSTSAGVGFEAWLRSGGG